MSDTAPLHVRAISLVLALSVVVGGWLALEYNNRLSESAGQAVRSSGTGKPSEQTRQTPNASPNSNEQTDQSPRDVNLTFKCQKNGKISYSDTPCEVDAKVVSVTATEKLPPARDDRLAQMKRQVARMEAERHARDQAQAAVVASRTITPEPNKAIQCKEVDEWVAYFDSRLRQLHDAQTGDYLTGERKKWMDRRFELRC